MRGRSIMAMCDDLVDCLGQRQGGQKILYTTAESSDIEKCLNLHALLLALFMHGSCIVLLKPRRNAVPRCSVRVHSLTSAQISSNIAVEYPETAALIRMRCWPFSLLRGARLLAAVVRSPRYFNGVQTPRNIGSGLRVDSKRFEADCVRACPQHLDFWSLIHSRFGRRQS